eukprot:7866099-Ditylum_brightwellii.AAC.1
MARNFNGTMLFRITRNGQPLLVLDPKVAGYETIELYQWGMCIQFHSHGACMKIPMVDVGDKINKIVIKLHKTHGKNKFLIFKDADKVIKLETFPKKTPEIKAFLDYKVCKKLEMYCSSYT